MLTNLNLVHSIWPACPLSTTSVFWWYQINPLRTKIFLLNKIIQEMNPQPHLKKNTANSKPSFLLLHPLSHLWLWPVHRLEMIPQAHLRWNWLHYPCSFPVLFVDHSLLKETNQRKYRLMWCKMYDEWQQHYSMADDLRQRAISLGERRTWGLTRLQW